MVKIGINSIDITPKNPVWLTGYGSRDRKSEGAYQSLMAGAIAISGESDEVLILTADLIGYNLAYAAAAKARIAESTGLLPRQVVLTATHTHCAPFFYPMAMPGEPETEYAEFLEAQLVAVAVSAKQRQVSGEIGFSRGRSEFGVSRRLPDGEGGVRFAPNPDGPMDRDLDTLWFNDSDGSPLGSLTIFGCHPTSRGGYLLGGDYPGFLCRALSEETNAPAFFSTGCAGNIRPWFKGESGGFETPSLEELETASRKMSEEVLDSRQNLVSVNAETLRVTSEFHHLPYADLPDVATLADTAESHSNPLRRAWAAEMLKLAEAGGLPKSCPQEIQVVQFNENLRAVFLGGEVLTEIGLHIKAALQPATTITVAYSNGLIAYVPSQETYDLGGYEVDGSHFYFLRPAPFAKAIEGLIVAKTVEMSSHA
jgi:neutral ceramidase